MKLEQKMEIARRLYEADDKKDAIENPRLFRPLPDLNMVAEWEPEAGWRYKAGFNDR